MKKIVDWNWFLVIAGLALFWAGSIYTFKIPKDVLIILGIIFIGFGLYLANNKK